MGKLLNPDLGAREREIGDEKENRDSRPREVASCSIEDLCRRLHPTPSSNTQSQHSVMERDRMTQQTAQFRKGRRGRSQQTVSISNTETLLGRFCPSSWSDWVNSPGLAPWESQPPNCSTGPAPPCGVPPPPSSSLAACCGRGAMGICPPWRLSSFPSPFSACRRLEMKGHLKFQPQTVLVLVHGLFCPTSSSTL